MSIKRIIIVHAIIFISLGHLYAGGSSQFRLEKNKELILLAAGGGVLLSGIVLKSGSTPPRTEPAGWLTWPVFPYNKGLADASNVLVAAGLTTLPFLLSSWKCQDTATLGVMYVEAISLTWGIKESLKAVFTKNRPYTAYPDTPAVLMESSDRYYSFPSGHTSIAFTTAGFATAVFAASNASPPMKYLFGGVNFLVASGVAALRVTSGEHYLIDVTTGALLGTVSGLLIPYLHKINRLRDNVTISAGTNTVYCTLSY